MQRPKRCRRCRRPRPSARNADVRGTRACVPRAHRRTRAGRSCMARDRCRAHARTRPRARSPAATRSVARRHGRDQGHHRHRRSTDAPRLADLRERRAGRRRCMRVARAGARRADSRQDGDDGIRIFPSRTDGQSAQPAAYAGRVVERLRRGGGRLDGAARVGYADGRIDHPAGGFLRHRRIQADVRPAERHGDQAVRAESRHARLPCP